MFLLDIVFCNGIIEIIYQVSLGQDEGHGLSFLGFFDFIYPVFDILKGIMTVGGDANHKGVSV